MSERKYRQRGYQDDEPRRERSATPRREAREGPRGRGLGAPTKQVFRCRDCGAEQSLSESVAFDATCGSCGAALHSCVNCASFDPGARWECRQSITEPIRSKTKPNRCELYSEKIALESDGEAASDPSDPRAAFEALFR